MSTDPVDEFYAEDSEDCDDLRLQEEFLLYVRRYRKLYPLPEGWSETDPGSPGQRDLKLESSAYRVSVYPGDTMTWPRAYITRTDGQPPTDHEARDLFLGLFGDELDPQFGEEYTPLNGPTEAIVTLDHPEGYNPESDA